MATITVISPYDGHVISDIPCLEWSDAELMLTKAQGVFEDRKHWIPPYERRVILEKLAKMMTERRDELAKQAASEGGKPLIDSQVETDRAIQGVHVAIETMSHMKGEQIPMNMTTSSANRMAFTYREPVGVVLSISAFNHPLNLIIHQVVPAVAVGAPVIVKPASSTPLSCFSVVAMLHEAGLPEAWCQAIACNNEVASKLVTDDRIRFLSFIGSAKVGWMLRSMLPNGATCALEHGGAAPVVVAADANLEVALPLLVKGGFYHAGQVCVSVQRVIADDKICDQLAEKMAVMAAELRVGDPVSPDTEVGPLIDPNEVNRVASWVDEAVSGGAKLLCGGNKISDTCYQPTVLLDAPLDSNVCQKEIFGPVVCINRYKEKDEAVTIANQVPFSFQAAVFSQDIDFCLEMVKRLKARAVMVNDHTAFRVDWMPFAGREESGMGIGGIPYSMEDMTYEKMMVIKSSSL